MPRHTGRFCPFPLVCPSTIPCDARLRAGMHTTANAFASATEACLGEKDPVYGQHGKGATHDNDLAFA